MSDYRGTESGWDIRLQCTVCGFRVRRHRNDYNGRLQGTPVATIETECSNCDEEIRAHFVDYYDPLEEE